MMLTGPEQEVLPVQIACLEGRLQQVAQEWNHLGDWLKTDQTLLASVQGHTTQVHALLRAPAARDWQVRHALTELLVIGHIQQDVLKQTIRRDERERSQLAAEQAAIKQTLDTIGHL